MTVELRHLRALLAIAEEGSITAAAARLRVGQPALSRTLRALERHLGVRLVDRSTHHLHLTAAGVAFRARAEAAVAAVDAALDPGRIGVWPLRLGHAWSALGDRTGELLRRWHAAHPDTPLELVRVESRDGGLAAGAVDAALVRGPVTAARMRWLRAEPRAAAVPVESPLADRSVVTLADLAAYPVVVNPVSGTTTAELWPPGDRPSTVPVGSTEEWLAAIAAGRGVGISSSATALLHGFPGVAFVALGAAPGLPVPDLDLAIAWNDPPTHPMVSDLVALAVATVAPGGDPQVTGRRPS